MGCACFYVVGAVVISVGRCGACVYVYENVKRYNVKTLIERAWQAKEPEKWTDIPVWADILRFQQQGTLF